MKSQEPSMIWGIGGKRGRETTKTPVVGIVELNGEVRTEVIKKGVSMNFTTLKRIFDKNVDKFESLLITDEYKGYSSMSNYLAHKGA